MNIKHAQKMKEWKEEEREIGKHFVIASVFLFVGMFATILFMFVMIVHSDSVIEKLVWIGYGFASGTLLATPLMKLMIEDDQIMAKKRHIHHPNCLLNGKLVRIETQFGYASWSSPVPSVRLERYKCTECGSITRFEVGNGVTLESEQ